MNTFLKDKYKKGGWVGVELFLEFTKCGRIFSYYIYINIYSKMGLGFYVIMKYNTIIRSIIIIKNVVSRSIVVAVSYQLDCHVSARVSQMWGNLLESVVVDLIVIVITVVVVTVVVSVDVVVSVTVSPTRRQHDVDLMQ